VTQYRDTGVVLRTWKLGEADRIVVLFTRDHGKVRAVAKGVRRTRSKFGARLEPTSHVSLQMHVGRSLDTIVQAETIEHHRALREDLDRLAEAVTMLEVVDQLAVEGEADRPLFELLVRAMATLAQRGAALVVPAFLLKALGAAGFGPVVDACAVCGDDGPLVAFDTDRGGMLCAAHRQGMAVSPAAVDLVGRILGGGLAGALEEPASPATHEVSRIATTAMEHHLERRLRAPTILHGS
jgi:DNA repair protein RecO (recombination protein O)